jgi:hypothetical protein
MTLGNAARCPGWPDCLVQGVPPSGRPDPAEMAQPHGPETTVPDWRKRLVCSHCGSHEIDMVVTGTKSSKRLPGQAP